MVAYCSGFVDCADTLAVSHLAISCIGRLGRFYGNRSLGIQLELLVPGGSRVLGMQAGLIVPDGFTPLVVLGGSRPSGIQA